MFFEMNSMRKPTYMAILKKVIYLLSQIFNVKYN